MKWRLKLIYTCILCLMTAVVGYPLLHETGHFLAATVLRAEEIDMRLFPVPYVRCRLPTEDSLRYALVGFAGLTLPLLSFLLRPRRFTLWIVNECMKCAATVAWLFSCVAVVCLLCGVEWQGEDVIRVIQQGGINASACVALCTGVTLVCGALFFHGQPLKKAVNYF